MRQIRVQLSCIFLLIPFLLLAQNVPVRGVVKDAKSGIGLQGANVFVNPYFATITGINGGFELWLPPDSFKVLRVSYIGYEEAKVELNGKMQFLEIELSEFSNILDPIVISAGKSEQRQTRTTVSIQSIQPYLVKNRITTDLENVMNQVPGVSTSDGQVNIRAGSGWSYGTGSRVTVLVDEMPMMAGGTGQILWSFLPLENIEQIEVIKGASSVLYGSSALNGVVNIRTAWPMREKISASLLSGVYDNPAKSSWKWQGDRVLKKNGGHFLYGNSNKQVQYVLSAFFILDDSYRMGEKDNRLRLSAKIRKMSKDHRWTYGLSANVLAGRTGSFLLWDSYEHALTSLDSQATLNSPRRVNIDPFVTYRSGIWKHEIRSRVLWVRNNIDPLAGQPDQSNQTDLGYLEYRLSPEFKWLKSLKLNFGAVAQYGESAGTMFQGKRIQSNMAAYVQADYHKKKLDLSIGARYEAYRLEKYKEAKPVFKFGANYEVVRGTFVRASAGQGYRFPVVSESFIRTQAGPIAIFPNPDLKSETGYTAEVGLRQIIPIKKLKMLLDFAVYRMEYQNMMEFSFGSWGNTGNFLNDIGFKSLNIGKSRIDGFEISLSGEAKWGNKKVRFISGYNYANPVNLQPDYIYSNVNNLALNYKTSSSDTSGTILKYRNRHLIKSDIQLDWKRFSFGMTYRYISSMEAIDAIFEQSIFSTFVPGIKEAREEDKPGNHIVDLRASWNMSSDWKIGISVENVFNTVYMTRPADIRPPRTFVLQLSYKY